MCLQGFDKSGFDRNGFDKYGYDRAGFRLNADGLLTNPLGYLKSGKHKDG